MATERAETAVAPAEADSKRGAQAQIAIAVALAGAVGFIVFAAIFALRAPDATPNVALAYSAAFVALLVAGGLAWWFIDGWLARPMARLAAEARMIAETRSDVHLDTARYRLLQPLPGAVDQLARAFLTAQRDVQRTIATATQRAEEQKERLEAILRDLSEGVLVCNLDHQILLYNQVALSLLHVTGELGLGRTLFKLITREPVLHAFDRLTQLPATGPREDNTVTLVCATIDSRTLLSGRMSLVLDAAQLPTGYVLTFADATRDIAELSRRDTLLRNATEGLRQPIANLRAAVETLSAYPNVAPAERRAFEEVILREGNVLSERLEALDRDYRSLSAGHWPLADIHSVDLFRCVERSLAEAAGPQLTMVGMPLWLHGDSHSLALALHRLLLNLAAATGTRAFDIEALLGDKRVYIDIAWSGAPLSSSMLDGWSAETLPGALGSATLRDVLSRHGSEMWSRPAGPERALLRIPVPAPARVQFAPRTPAQTPPRPEFYDFDLLHLSTGERAGPLPLRSLSYVVFDTETTGLKPSQGDELISVGAVRIVNRRILTGETFARLINPKRPIPAESIRFHHITDAMVADAPPVEIVLPQFRAFAADSVLVAHNAAFDLKFLRLKEESCAVRFDNVPLDTLLISSFLFPEFDDHSLDAIAQRLKIEIAGRHTALGDAMATAAIFVRLLELIEARGIATLDALLDASKMAYEIRARQAVF